MNPDVTPPTENEPYHPSRDGHPQEPAGGGGGGKRLALLAGGLALLGVGYLLVPKGQGQAGGTPSFEQPAAAATSSISLADSAVRTAPAEAATAATATSTATSTAAAAAAAAARPAATVAPTASPAASAAEAAAAEAAGEAAAPAAEPAAAPPAASAPAPSSATETITGRITDENGQPLVAATVLLRGSSKAVSTDTNGNYAIEVPAGDNKLLFGYGGYLDEVVESRGGKPVNVTLMPSPGSKKRRR